MSYEAGGRAKGHYLGIFMSIVVLLLISSMIVAAIVIINPDIVNLAARNANTREAVTLQEAMLGDLSPNHFEGHWTSDTDQRGRPIDQLLTTDAHGNIQLIKLPIVLNKPTENSSVPQLFEPEISIVLRNSSMLASVGYNGYKLSPSKRFLLIWVKWKRHFRHTSSAQYFVYDLKRELVSMLSTRSLHQLATGSAGQSAAYLHNSYEPIDAAASFMHDRTAGKADLYSRFQVAEWFSSASGSDSLLLVQNNDIYTMLNIHSDAQHSGLPEPTRLTYTGKLGELFNGVPDWLYEEEILGDSPAFELSPSSRTLAFMSFNDSLVDQMPFSVYGNGEQVIPTTRQIRYPKAGRINPIARVHLIDNLEKSVAAELSAPVRATASPAQLDLVLPDDLGLRQHYISRLRWLTDDRLALVWLSRQQNESYHIVCSRETQWKCEKNLYLSSPGGWLEPSDQLEPLDQHHYLALLPKDEGPDVGSFKHLAKVTIGQPDEYQFLTSGRRELVSIERVNPNSGLVFYTSTLIGEPGQRQVFASSLNGTQERPEVCLTCALYPQECLYNYAKFSPSSAYYIFDCAGPTIPRSELRSLPDKLTDSSETRFEGRNQASTHLDSPLLWTFEANLELRQRLTFQKAMPISFRLKVPIAATNYSANVLLYLPPQLGTATALTSSPNPPQALVASSMANPRQPFTVGPRAPPRYLHKRDTMANGREQPRGQARGSTQGFELAIHEYLTPDTVADYLALLQPGQQYPMVVEVYAGPGSQKVDFSYHLGLGHYMASSRRVVYAMIDGRGSGYEGSKRLFELYHKLGTVEIDDQIQVARYLANNFTFIDPNRVAIWGWSYGGYAAAKALAKSSALARQRIPSASVDQSLLSLVAGNHLRPAIQLNKSSAAAASVSTNIADPVKQNQSSDIRPSLGRPDQAPLNESVDQDKHTLALSKATGIFECAASVAPVTNWILYDTAYTERFMSSPYMNERFDNVTAGDHAQSSLDSGRKLNGDQQLIDGSNWHLVNETSLFKEASESMRNSYSRYLMSKANIKSGSQPDMNSRYKDASLWENVANMDRKRFLLIHGTADDNVHFQQSIMLMRRLIQQNVLFETRLYPDQDHSIANRADKLHLGNTLSKFFSECFDMAY